jgi:hypothetical protein
MMITKRPRRVPAIPKWAEGKHWSEIPEWIAAFEHDCDLSERYGIDRPDDTILDDFDTLQAIWREAATSRLSYRRQERQAWCQLIEHLTNLPPPRE